MSRHLKLHRGHILRAALLTGLTLTLSLTAVACKSDDPAAGGEVEPVQEKAEQLDDQTRASFQTLAQVMVDKPAFQAEIMRLSCTCGGEAAYKEMGYADRKECLQETSRLASKLQEAVPCIYEQLEKHTAPVPRDIDQIVQCMKWRVTNTSECFESARRKDDAPCSGEVALAIMECQKQVQLLSGAGCMMASDHGEEFEAWLEEVDGVEECLSSVKQEFSD